MHITRRQFAVSVAGSLAGLAASPALASMPDMKQWRMEPTRALSFLNLHTGERAKAVTYFDKGRYVPDALAELNKVMRDHRSGDVAQMDPKLMDLVHLLHQRLDSKAEVQIISAYRSPNSNAMLASRSGGVAKKSYHMKGMAIDLKLADRELRSIRDAARSLKMGGVGQYSQFVHVDTGPVRTW